MHTAAPFIRTVETVSLFEAEAIPHLPVMKRIARKMMRSNDEAEDLVQETFAQAWQSFNRYESGTNCRAWLCRIMFYKRSHRIRAAARLVQLGENEFAPAGNAVREPLSPEFMSEKVAVALKSVPEKFRRIVWLYDVENYTYREIAAKLEIPIGTVMSRLSRGRRLLRGSLSECAADYRCVVKRAVKTATS